LEEVRMLSNLETEKSKLIHIVLVGQPNLRDLLARPDLEQLRQRVTVSYHIDPLTADDTHAYINHRLKHASIGAPLTFPRGVTDLIHEHSRGIARMINVIADATLLYGYGADKHAIDLALTREVLAELGLAEMPDVPDVEIALAPEPTNDEDPDLPLRAMAAAPSLSAQTVHVTAPAPGVAAPAITPRTTAPPFATPAFSTPPITSSPAVGVAMPARIIVAPPTHYMLSDPPRKGGGAWWTRLWRSAFGTPRPAPES
ncbi:MAG TPA: hypothetical protein VLV86_02895, partial [Vicinamibacterales bacterium]|nr:hypothetical protein [Vicinamibacterales bacterium]